MTQFQQVNIQIHCRRSSRSLTDKKVLHIQSRGGFYSEGPADVESGDRYLRTIMTFLGVPSYENVIIEGHNAEPERTEEIKAASITEAQEMGKISNKHIKRHCVVIYAMPFTIQSYLLSSFKCQYLEILLCNSIVLP